MEIKEENDGSSLTFTRDEFPPTNVVGTEGSVLDSASLVREGEEELVFQSSKLYLPFISR